MSFTKSFAFTLKEDRGSTNKIFDAEDLQGFHEILDGSIHSGRIFIVGAIFIFQGYSR